jgi:hypothetical protein
VFILRKTEVRLDAAHPQLHSHAAHGNEIKETAAFKTSSFILAILVIPLNFLTSRSLKSFSIRDKQLEQQ